MKFISKLSAGALALGFFGSVHAFDGSRQGFFLSLGAGFSNSEYDSDNFARSDRSGLGTSFKLIRLFEFPDEQVSTDSTEISGSGGSAQFDKSAS